MFARSMRLMAPVLAMVALAAAALAFEDGQAGAAPNAAAVERILAGLPAKSVAEGHALIEELARLGPAAVAEVCGLLVPAGAGDDGKARFALHGLALHAARPGAAPERESVETGVLQALAAGPAPEVAAFLASQLQLAGTDRSVPQLAKLLADAALVDPAARALGAIGTPAAGAALASALAGAAGAGRIPLIQALGWMRAETGAAEALLPLAASADPEVRSAAWDGLSRLWRAGGFEPLFNGRDLRGWIGDTAGYVVENGALICRRNAEGHGPGNLYTEREYGDFVLRFEFKLTPGANNGLGIRMAEGSHAAYDAMELQILDDDAEQYARLAPYQYHGSIYGVVPAKRGHLRPAGEWNVQEVTARGSRITVRLNGAVIVDADIVEASKNGTLDGQAHPGLARRKGHLAFLGHGDHVEFRNIRIQDLGP